jgi:hypothetical protein
MDSVKLKELVIGSIRHHFDEALKMVEQVGGAGGKAPSVIENVKSSLIKAATSVNARVYDDHEFSDKLLNPGVDLAYRNVIVSDVTRNDEWLAGLAVGLEALDEKTRNVVGSWHNQNALKRDLGKNTARRLLVIIVCAKKIVTMNPFCTIVTETEDKSLALTPCVFSWSIPQSDGKFAVVDHVELQQELLEQANRMLSVIDSSNSARLLNDHIRGTQYGTTQ